MLCSSGLPFHVHNGEAKTAQQRDEVAPSSTATTSAAAAVAQGTAEVDGKVHYTILAGSSGLELMAGLECAGMGHAGLTLVARDI
jgi:hypothetical protein